jgi:chromosome segregation ATPase
MPSLARLARYDARLEQQDAKLEQQDAKHEADIKDLKVENEALKAKYEADVKELKAEYQAKLERRSADNEARVKDLEAEFQTLKDGQRTAPDTPGNTESEGDQPLRSELPSERQDARAAENKDDREGLRSNAKYQLYGAAGGLIGALLLDKFVPGISRVLGDIIVSGPAVIAAFVPVRREGWREKHDDSLDKP